MAQSTAGEHHLPMAPHGVGNTGNGGDTLEKQLNGFVRAVALIERAGNALGTLAFTWATVVLLGGYPTVLREDNDFWFATVIVFLEASRMFSRNNRLDYQLFFDTRGAFKPLGWNGLTVAVGFSVLVFLIDYKYELTLPGPRDTTELGELIPKDTYVGMHVIVAALAALAVARFLSAGLARLLGGNLLFTPFSLRATSLLSPFVPVICLGLIFFSLPNYEGRGGLSDSETAKLVLFLPLLVAVLLLTISRLRFPSIIKLVDRALGSKRVFWHRVILNSCMLATTLMLALWLGYYVSILELILIEVCAVAVLVTFGNLQIPAATVRLVLPIFRLVPHDYYDKLNDGRINLVPSLDIFYGMVLGQGILYGAACILELFSLFPRRSLARHGGFGGRWGVESVNLYYAYAFEKYMQGDILAPKNINLNNFAVDSLNSDTPKMQFHGIRIMHSLLQKQPARRQFILKLNTSLQTMARLISMLDWTSPEDTTVRLFAAKVTAELATSIRVVNVPGTIQVVSMLLDCCNQQKRGCPLLETNAGQEKIHDSVLNVDENQEERLNEVADTGSLLETQGRSTADEHKFWMRFKCCQRIFKFWLIPQEETLTEQDLLPALAMLILDGLASCDQGNCVEINRSSGLIPKIIAFTSCRRSDTTYTDAQRKVLVKSSLKLLHRLTGVDGEIGLTLRHKVSKSPFLLRNLAEILEDGRSSQELRKLVVGILRNLAIDENSRQKIGRIQVIITWLKQTFLRTDSSSSTDADRLLREVAGQALAMLAMDNVNNCLAMLGKTGHEFIMVLTSMIHIDRYRCVAASLLRNICQNARPELKEPDLKELSYCLRQVLEIILVTDQPELEIFIGLGSQICNVIPGDFIRELEDGHIKDKFVKRLVDALNANMEPSPHCPGIRRVILEQTINMMENDCRYINYFIDRRMAEALYVLEETASEAENYSLFMGDVGLMEAREPLSSLVVRAKQLMDIR